MTRPRKTTCARDGGRCPNQRAPGDHYCKACRKAYNRDYWRRARLPRIEANRS